MSRPTILLTPFPRVLVLLLAALFLTLTTFTPAHAASSGSITSHANAQRAAAGAKALKSNGGMNEVALNAAKRYASAGAMDGSSLTGSVPSGWTGTQTVRQMVSGNDPARAYSKALASHGSTMNAAKWTDMGTGFASANNKTFLVLVYATYPPPAPPVKVDPAPAPVPAPVVKPAPAPVPVPARPTPAPKAPAPVPVAPAPAETPEAEPEPAPASKPAPAPAAPSKAPARPSKAPSKAPASPASPTASKNATPTPAASPTPSESAVPSVITRTVVTNGLSGEVRHTAAAWCWVGAAVVGALCVVSGVRLRRIRKSA